MMARRPREPKAEVCLHCEFFEAARRKYPDWAKSGDNPHPQDRFVMSDMLEAVTAITSQLMNGLSAEDRARYSAIALANYFQPDTRH